MSKIRKFGLQLVKCQNCGARHIIDYGKVKCPECGSEDLKVIGEEND